MCSSDLERAAVERGDHMRVGRLLDCPVTRVNSAPNWERDRQSQQLPQQPLPAKMYLRFLSRALPLSTAPLVLTLAAAASDGDGVTLLVALLWGRGGRCVEAAASVSVSLPSATFVPLRLLLCRGDAAVAFGREVLAEMVQFVL